MHLLPLRQVRAGLVLPSFGFSLYNQSLRSGGDSGSSCLCWSCCLEVPPLDSPHPLPPGWGQLGRSHSPSCWACMGPWEGDICPRRYTSRQRSPCLMASDAVPADFFFSHLSCSAFTKACLRSFSVCSLVPTWCGRLHCLFRENEGSCWRGVCGLVPVALTPWKPWCPQVPCPPLSVPAWGTLHPSSALTCCQPLCTRAHTRTHTHTHGWGLGWGSQSFRPYLQ